MLRRSALRLEFDLIGFRGLPRRVKARQSLPPFSPAHINVTRSYVPRKASISGADIVTPGSPIPPIANSVFPSLAPESLTATLSPKNESDLQHGVTSPGAADVPTSVSEPEYPTVVQQALDNMRNFSHCVLLTRVGGFYELYLHQAEEYAPLLGLKLASKKTSAGPVAFAGFPYFQLDRFLKLLVHDMSKHVALSEEFPHDPATKVKSGGLLFNRRVDRIVTPGTLIDEKFMDPAENNFLLSVAAGPISGLPPGNCHIGLAWLDLSSGDFFTQCVSRGVVASAIARISPREIVYNRPKQSNQYNDNVLMQLISQGPHMVTQFEKSKRECQSRWASQFDDALDVTQVASFSDIEVEAAEILLAYVDIQLLGNVPKLRVPRQRHDEEHMYVDRNSLKALEIKNRLKDGSAQGSLLHAVRRTTTKSGSRLLSQRLTSPSASLEEINNRLNLVASMLTNHQLRYEVTALLKSTSDSWRLLQKFSFGRAVADDLLDLAHTIKATADIDRLLKVEANNRTLGSLGCLEGDAAGEADDIRHAIAHLSQRLELDKMLALSGAILQAIDKDKLSEQHSIKDRESLAAAQLAQNKLRLEGESGKLPGLPSRLRQKLKGESQVRDLEHAVDDVWIMRPNASPALEKLHAALTYLHGERDKLVTSLRQRSGVASLQLKWSPGLSHYCYMKGTGSQMESLLNARRVSQSKSTASFHVPEWSRLGGHIESAKLRIRSEEQKVFARLREQVICNLVPLRKNATVLDELDVACSFATVALEQNWVRPQLNYGSSHNIIQGRHATVEAGLASDGRSFTSNNCQVGEEQRILLITGPNMAGKSTYLRQNALISILAQSGSFVPAESASIGIVDKIFSRVGSADNLFNDQSTFMVEMLETAEILHQATPRSFVIMDEIGRGTTPEDGIAVGYAALHYLYNVNRCRTLFATHFHSLADMTSTWNGLACYCTDVAEQKDGSFIYSHKLRAGVNRSSHALKVAQLAGLPEQAIRVAASVLDGRIRGDGSNNCC